MTSDMRICTRLFVIAAICGLLTASAWDKVSFDWKPLKGSKANYTTTNRHEADLGGGVVDLVVTWDSTITVEKVDGKRVWLDIYNEEPAVEIDGGAANRVQVQVPARRSSTALTASTTQRAMATDTAKAWAYSPAFGSQKRRWMPVTVMNSAD